MDVNFIRNITTKSREETKKYLSEFIKLLDFRNDEHQFLYDQTILRVFGSNAIAFSHTLKDQTIEFTRVRKCGCKGTFFNNISELIYPPAKYAKMGRANLEGEALFYCSNDPGTSIFEVRPQLGDWIATSTFRCDRNNVKSIVLGADTNTLPNFDKLPPYLQGLHDFLKQIFTERIKDEEEYNYYKTATICKSIISNTKSIVYPSVASNLEGWNYIFSTDEFDSHFDIVESRLQEVIEYKSPFEFKVKCLHVANFFDEHGDVRWEKKLPECDGHDIHEMIYL